MTKAIRAPYLYGSLIGIALLIAGVTYAAFSDQGKVLGSTFYTGSADIKFLAEVTAMPEPGSLVDTLPGPTFENIGSNWQTDYLIKIFNNGTYPMALTSNANYETASDPDDLRQIIYVEPIEWHDDQPTNGEVDIGELGTSLGKKSILHWKTEGYDLGTLPIEETKGYVLRFSTDDVSSTKQGKTGIYDFEFDAIQQD